MTDAGPIHAFLAGRGRDGRGRGAADILDFDDAALERYHDYIQWLFPLPTASAAVPGSPVLSPAEIAAIRGDAEALATLRAAAARLRRFYADNDDWLVARDHNHLRISRIIASLRLLVGYDEARAFHEAAEARVQASGGRVNADSRRYWRAALGEPG